MKDINYFNKLYHGNHYYSLNQYLREQFGEKVYKIALDGGMTCPNRDGTLGRGGCIFCSGGGSGDFAEKLSGGRGYVAESRFDNDSGSIMTEPRFDNDSGSIMTEPRSDNDPGSIMAESRFDNDPVSVTGKRLHYVPGSVMTQIESAKARIRQKSDARLFIAYYQSYTNTYAPVEYLRQLFTEAITHPDIVALSIGTRPDCLPEEVLDLLAELNRIKPVWVELGLQTIHEDTAKLIRRGYPLSVYEEAVDALHERNITVITHVILGLPGEDKEGMLKTVAYLAERFRKYEVSRPVGTAIHDGIKLQLLHVLEHTDLAELYQTGAFRTLEMEEYLDIVGAALRLLPSDMVIHRLTGDGPKKLLIAPLWSGNKKLVLNTLQKKLREEEIYQGVDTE